MERSANEVCSSLFTIHSAASKCFMPSYHAVSGLHAGKAIFENQEKEGVYLLGVMVWPEAFRPERRRANPPQAQGEAIDVPAQDIDIILRRYAHTSVCPQQPPLGFH